MAEDGYPTVFVPCEKEDVFGVGRRVGRRREERKRHERACNREPRVSGQACERTRENGPVLSAKASLPTARWMRVILDGVLLDASGVETEKMSI